MSITLIIISNLYVGLGYFNSNQVGFKSPLLIVFLSNNDVRVGTVKSLVE